MGRITLDRVRAVRSEHTIPYDKERELKVRRNRIIGYDKRKEFELRLLRMQKSGTLQRIEEERREKRGRQRDPLQPYHEYLRGKNVIVVGSAAYMEGLCRGEQIDNYDVVVRLNRVWAEGMEESDYGRKTDIIYAFTTLKWHVDETKFDENLKWYVLKLHKPKILPRLTQSLPSAAKLLIPPAVAADKNNVKADMILDELRAIMRTEPYTGVYAMYHLLKSQLKTLTVAGMDLYKSDTVIRHPQQRPLLENHHNGINHRAFLSMIKDDRLILDQPLKEAVEEVSILTDKKGIKLPPVSLIIPFTSDCPQRNRIFKWNMERYKKVFPEFQVCVGEDHGEKFNKSKAINSAVKEAKHELLLFADADVFFTRDTVARALEIIETYVRGYSQALLLSENCTNEILSGSPKLNQHRAEIEKIYGYLPKSDAFCLMTRECFDQSGGMDEQFEGWGGEDEGFAKILQILCGEPQLMELALYHLYHPPAPERDKVRAAYRGEGQEKNADLRKEYNLAKTKDDIVRIRGF